ncbi:helix-turn-helix domain-containing protein [Streptomyces sp. NPDC059717]|uniref:helix-turn-helix domain-containing protein n=1 Tax=Streptomyces sp. NPDC059717 TaxID=3346922 RepID=UPI0036BE9FE0
MECFQAGQKNAEVADALRVSERSVERWRRAWREQGEAGVLSKGLSGAAPAQRWTNRDTGT